MYVGDLLQTDTNRERSAGELLHTFIQTYINTYMYYMKIHVLGLGGQVSLELLIIVFDVFRWYGCDCGGSVSSSVSVSGGVSVSSVSVSSSGVSVSSGGGSEQQGHRRGEVLHPADHRGDSAGHEGSHPRSHQQHFLLLLLCLPQARHHVCFYVLAPRVDQQQQDNGYHLQRCLDFAEGAHLHHIAHSPLRHPLDTNRDTI
jgi:hypothetical protein